MIKKLNEEWMATIEGWYEEVFKDEKGWILEPGYRNFFGRTKRSLANALMYALEYQAEMFILESNQETITERNSNIEKLEEEINELLETPIE